MRALQLSKRLSSISHSSSFCRTLTSFAHSSLHSVSDLLSPPDPHLITPTVTGSITSNLQTSLWSAIQYRGVKVSAIDLKPGNVIERKGKIYEVVEAEHRQRGRGGATMQLELRNVDNGNKESLRFGPEDSVEKVFVQERSFKCLYAEHGTVYLMDPVKFEQLEVPTTLFGDAAAFLKEEMEVKLQLFDERPLSGSIPKQVTCTIMDTQPPMKGLTAAPRYKRATLDNNLTVQVPAFLDVGEEIIINTIDSSYISRA